MMLAFEAAAMAAWPPAKAAAIADMVWRLLMTQLRHAVRKDDAAQQSKRC